MISVIMPVYNSQKYLKAAIDSVLSQDVDLEIIAIDDCSEDSSRDILTELSEKDTRIKPFFNEKNSGVAEVRNKALTLASGEHLAFCDSDDIVPPGAYKALLSAIGNSDIAIGAHQDLYDDGSSDALCAVSQSNSSSLFKSLFTVSCLWTKLIRRSFIMENSLKFDPQMKIGEDVVFLAEAVTKSPSYKVTDALVYYHCQHADPDGPSLTHIYSFDAFKLHISCREKILEICKDVSEARIFVYTNFSGFLTSFILKMPIGEDLNAAFELFKSHIMAYEGFADDNSLFKAVFCMDYEDFAKSTANRYVDRVRSVPAREQVLNEYEAGRIGFVWIFKYFKAWLNFKLKRGKCKK